MPRMSRKPGAYLPASPAGSAPRLERYLSASKASALAPGAIPHKKERANPMLDEKSTAKALKLLQQFRDELEGAGDQYGAAKLNIAIGAIIEASTEAEQPAATPDQLVELGKRAALASDFRTSSQ